MQRVSEQSEDFMEATPDISAVVHVPFIGTTENSKCPAVFLFPYSFFGQRRDRRSNAVFVSVSITPLTSTELFPITPAGSLLTQHYSWWGILFST